MSDSADLLSPAAEPAWPHAAVLIVDDEQGMRHFLSRALAPRFGRVDAVDSAEAGRDLVAAHRYDLVILDITLPGLSGLAWLRELRAQGHAGEVILITAFADLDTAFAAVVASLHNWAPGTHGGRAWQRLQLQQVQREATDQGLVAYSLTFKTSARYDGQP